MAYVFVIKCQGDLSKIMDHWKKSISITNISCVWGEVWGNINRLDRGLKFSSTAIFAIEIKSFRASCVISIMPTKLYKKIIDSTTEKMILYTDKEQQFMALDLTLNPLGLNILVIFKLTVTISNRFFNQLTLNRLLWTIFFLYRYRGGPIKFKN